MKLIEAQGSRALALHADVSKEDAGQAMFAEMLQQWGTIDILVNNAGLQQDSAFPDMTPATMAARHRRESHRPIPLRA